MKELQVRNGLLSKDSNNSDQDQKHPDFESNEVIKML